MSDEELLAYLVHETRTTLAPAYVELQALDDVPEGQLARVALRRMLDFTENPISPVAFIHEARNALVPARHHLFKITKFPQAEFARAAIQRLLDFVTECTNEYDRRYI